MTVMDPSFMTKKQRVRVSVVIPARNREQLTLRALRSVQQQTLAPHQVIVVDDGSEDNTLANVQAEFPDVQLLTQSPKGVSAARNAGIQACQGTHIAFLDSDDEWASSKLERQIHALQQMPEHKVVHSDEIWIRDGKRVNAHKKHRKYGGWIYPQCLPLCCISPSAVLIEREVFDVVGLFDEQLPVCEDYDLWLRICCRYPVLYLDQALVVKYGGHADQLSKSVWGMDRYRVIALEKSLAYNPLRPAWAALTAAMLREKIEIILLGARKRERSDLIDIYEKKLRLCPNFQKLQ